MIELLNTEAMKYGNKLKLIPVERLTDLQEELIKFKSSVELNGFQQWIVNDLYQFRLPDTGFPIRSVLIVALPHPPYARVDFVRQGNTYHFLSLVMPDFGQTETYLSRVLEQEGYHLINADNLPLKRLAVKSGLAVYGRNNICYVDGMGSNLSFAAYFTDLSSDDSCWTELQTADLCKTCKICFKHCPTGAIREDRFLIDNEKCLSAKNEIPDAFPEWIPLDAHHTLYDCLQCQVHCPLNREYQKTAIGPICFEEEETKALLSGDPFESFQPELKDKCRLLGLTQWMDAIPRNLSVLFDTYEEDRYLKYLP